jgi:colanic acid/amylovoran biosynthesis protein
MKKGVHFLVLHGVNYWNLGDLGILLSMLLRLREKVPDAVLTISTPYTADHLLSVDLEEIGCREVCDYLTFEGGLPLSYKVRKVLLGVVKLLKLWVYTRINLPATVFSAKERLALEAYETADVVIGGWGEKIVDTGKGFPLWAAYPILVAILLRKRIAISSASIGPFRRRLVRELYRWILGKTDLILVREPFSFDETSRMNLARPEVHLTADEAFLLPSARSERTERIAEALRGGHPVVGISVLNWYFPSASDPNEESVGYANAIAALTDRLVCEKGAKVLLMAHNVHERIQNDRVVVAQILRRVQHREKCYVLPFGLSPQEEKEVLRHIDVLVGTRMHSNVFALSAGIPVLAVAYSPKTLGIMSMLGLKEWVVPIEEVAQNPRVLWSKLEMLLEQKARNEYLERLQGSMPGIRAAARQNARSIKRLTAS